MHLEILNDFTTARLRLINLLFVYMYTPFPYTGGYNMWKPCGQNKPYCFIFINEIIRLFTNATGVMSLSTVKLF